MNVDVTKRKLNTLNNAKYNLIFYIIQIILRFAMQTVFISVLGREFLGLNGLFSNILTLLSVAELGISNAIVFSMYKPIAENDIEKVNKLFSLYKKLYIIIATVVLVLGLSLLPFLKYLIKEEAVTVSVNIYVIYLIFLFNTVLSYFIAHRKSLLFAYQRNDIETKISIIKLILLNLIQLIILLTIKNYYVYLIVLPISTVIESILVYFISKKCFPEIHYTKDNLDEDTKKEIKKNTFALVFHKIGGTLVYATDNILISALIGLSVLGVYSNYYLVIASLITIFNFVSSSVKSSLGNYIATRKETDTFVLFKNFNYILMGAVGFSCASLVCLYQPFISLWLGPTFLLPLDTMFLIVISFYLNVSKNMVCLFKETAGKLWEDRFRPLIESAINISVSIILGLAIGINGIIIGTIASTILGPLWTEPYVLYKFYFKRNWLTYFIDYGKYLLINLVGIVSCYLICSLLPSTSLLIFIAKCFICLIVPNIIFILLTLKSNEQKYAIYQIKNIFKGEANGKVH